MDIFNKLEDLMKGLELGSYAGAPDTLTQGSALSIEDVSTVLKNVCYQDKQLFLQRELKSSKAKGQLYQFTRQFSYGNFDGIAQLEGAVGQEQTSDFARITVPMAYYSQVRQVTIAADMAETLDGVKAEDREAESAAKVIAGKIEMDLFRGKADFSNQGVFDGSTAAIPGTLADMVGVDVQIRQADYQLNSHDLMFEAFGGNLSNIIQAGGVLSQPNIEDTWIRGVLNHSDANELYLAPLALSAYSKASYQNKERINLGGSAQEVVTGADIRKQAVSGGVVELKPSRFLEGQTGPTRPQTDAPGKPTFTLAQSAGSTTFSTGQVYTYYVTAQNEKSAGFPSDAASITIAAGGNQVALTITSGGGTVRFYNVFRGNAGAPASKARFIGKVKVNGLTATTTFVDLNNRLPGATVAFLIKHDSMEIKELAPYSRLKLAVVTLAKPEAHFRFCCLAVMAPRYNVLCDNIIGSL